MYCISIPITVQVSEVGSSSLKLLINKVQHLEFTVRCRTLGIGPATADRHACGPDARVWKQADD